MIGEDPLDDAWKNMTSMCEAMTSHVDQRPLMRQLGMGGSYYLNLETSSYFAPIEPKHIVIVGRTPNGKQAWLRGVPKKDFADILPWRKSDGGLRASAKLFIEKFINRCQFQDVEITMYVVMPSGRGTGSAYSLALSVSKELSAMYQGYRAHHWISGDPQLTMANPYPVVMVARPGGSQRHWLLISTKETRLALHDEIDQLTDAENEDYRVFELGEDDWDPASVDTGAT